jgi:hypothetical protein
MESSPNPLPIHREPLKPPLGSAGPKAAGRARKKVELSSVKLIIADGGNNELGNGEENMALKLPRLDATEMRSCSSFCDVPRTMYRRIVTTDFHQNYKFTSSMRQRLGNIS